MQESLAAALRELTDENGGCWLGGGEQLIEELQRRVGSRATNPAGSPSSLLDLQEYMTLACGVFGKLDLDLLDFRELSANSLRNWRKEVTYLPGTSEWGPEAPMLACRRSRMPAVEYFWALGKILKYWDPFLLSLLIFTERDDDFGLAGRWIGPSFVLVNILRRHYPTFENVPYEVVSLAVPPGARGCLPHYENIHEYGGSSSSCPRTTTPPSTSGC